MSYYATWSYPMKYRSGPFPLVQRDQYGHRWVYDARNGTFQNLDLGTIIKVAGPLVAKYLVPFVKELVSGVKEQQPQPFWWWVPPVVEPVVTTTVATQTPCISTELVTERWLCSSPYCI